MTGSLQLIVNWVFPLSLLTLGVFQDLKMRKVRNEFIVIGFFMALILLLINEGVSGLPIGLLSLVAALGIGFPLYLLKIVGAGDVKLLMVLSLNLDWNAVLVVGTSALIWGALLGVFQMLLKKQIGYLVSNLVTVLRTRTGLESKELHHIPFTVALLFGWLTHVTLLQTGARFL